MRILFRPTPYVHTHSPCHCSGADCLSELPSLWVWLIWLTSIYQIRASSLEEYVHFLYSYCLLYNTLQGEDVLTCYTFNTHQAKHTFCSICGVESLHTPRSNPDGKGVALHCLDPGTVDDISVIKLNGQNWKRSMEENPSIREMSKSAHRIGLIFEMLLTPSYSDCLQWWILLYDLHLCRNCSWQYYWSIAGIYYL